MTKPILVFTLLILSCLPSCGFRPLYQNQNTATGDSTVLDAVWIDTIPNAAGQSLRNALLDRFYHHGTPLRPPYTLKVTLVEAGRDLAINRNDTVTRAQLVLRADYQLVDRSTGAVLDTGNIRAVNSYNILLSQYTTLVTQNQAREQSIQDLADKLSLRMGVVLEKLRAAQ